MTRETNQSFNLGTTTKMKIVNGLTIFLMINLITISLFTTATEAELYSPKDDVLILDGHSLTPELFESNQNVTFVIQFYNSFCGHCQMFAPIYKELASKFKNWGSILKVAAIDCSNSDNMDKCREARVLGYPTILLYPPHYQADNDKTRPIDMRTLNIEWTVDGLQEAIIKHVKPGASVDDLSNSNQVTKTSKGQEQGSEIEIDPEIYYLMHNDSIQSKRIFAVDLLKGISYMLTHEVRMKGDLGSNEFTTLRNILTILKKYIPLENWDPAMNDFITDLRTKLDEKRDVYEKKGISNQEMKDAMEQSGSDDIRTKYRDERWISCSDSEKNLKGYTCSLWLLFHSLTVGEYSKLAPVKMKPTLVLETMRDYITRFLGCSACSTNFAKETEGLVANLIGRNSSALWLWSTHNRVNLRLNNERGDGKRPLSRVIYPDHQRCSKCFKEHKNLKGTLDDVVWDLPEVLQFLVTTYKPENLVSPTEQVSLMKSIRRKLKYEMLQVHADGANSEFRWVSANHSIGQWNIQNLLSASDVSICLFLYLLCVIIVIIVGFLINPKWRRIKIM